MQNDQELNCLNSISHIDLDYQLIKAAVKSEHNPENKRTSDKFTCNYIFKVGKKKLIWQQNSKI